MAIYLETSEVPDYGQWWEAPDGQELWLVERRFPRFNRMACLMENIDGYSEWFVFPY
jgi:hypothetical protein